VIEPIQVRGLAEFNRSLRKINAELPKELRVALNKAAGIVAEKARVGVPRKSGRAAKSIRASSTRTAARVTGGSTRVSYYPWLDFGGKVGKKRSVHRAFLPGGRFIYPGYAAKRDEVQDEIAAALIKVAESAGFAVREGG
jgi:hypothetical protein